QCQHGHLRRYGKPVVPGSKQVAHCAFSNLRHIPRGRVSFPMTKLTVGKHSKTVTVTARDASTGQATGKRQPVPVRK
ncbi:MAG: hypothetical protein WCF29_13130, partial [Pseudolabrys sp.]